MIANSKVLSDAQLRITATGTIYGAAQAKGTATDLQLVVLGGPDGATAVAGSTAVSVQGSNLTATATSTWNAVTPDKGSFAAITASGQQVVHLANLQYAFYRVELVMATTATVDVETVFNFQNLQDSFDDSVA